MSKAPSKKARGKVGEGSSGSAGRKGKSRAVVYADLGPGVEEPSDVEASFAPVFDDLNVPAAVRDAFGAWLAAAAEQEACGPAAGDGDATDAEGEGCAGDGSKDRAQGACAAFALGFVARLDRGYPLVTTEAGSFRAEHAIALVKGADVRSAVGDWVAVRLPHGHDKALIERVLPRVSELSRWDGTGQGGRQVLAANLDVLLVAQPLSKRAVPLDRIVRSVVLAREGNARAAVVLTKADRSPSPERLAQDIAAVRAAVGSDVVVAAVSCIAGAGLEDVRALIPAGGAALLLGESGAGKSTLVNALLGAEVLGVGEVRGRDDQGRHTTVARRMLKVPAAGVLVDAPGLRSLPLLDEQCGLARTFPEIEALVLGCRFRDCTHGDEPGCAVRAGVAAGSVEPARLEEYRLLAAEMLANRKGLAPSAKASLTR